MTQPEARPPYIQFEKRSMVRRLDDGQLQYHDVDFVIITPQGTKDTIEKEAAGWLEQCRDQANRRRMPESWFYAFQSHYEAWKKNEELPTDGTPIKSWPLATPAEVQNILSVNIRTVEDLAQAHEEALRRLGMGARSLKQKAVDWVTAKGGTAPLVAQLDALRRQLEGLQERNESLTAQVKALEAQRKEPEVQRKETEDGPD